MSRTGRLILVSINLPKRGPEQRLDACEAAFGYARGQGVDELQLQPDFVETPPASIEQTLQQAIGGERRRWGRVKIKAPSEHVVAAALKACPYLKSVSLFKGNRLLVLVADAADGLDLTISPDSWATLRQELERVLGGDLRFDIAEVKGR